jgi:uncharacterized surface protein with fasciclin (FAS1) repeats
MTRAYLTRIALSSAFLAAPALLAAQNSHSGHKMNDIVAVAAGAGQFNTLVAAVKAAGLVETLQGAGPFTVFAPTDAAFARLPKGTVEALLADKKQLTAILTYHVIPGKLTAAEIVKLGGARPVSVNGAPVDITIRDGKVYIDGARVLSADVPASNGIIHVIDAVIQPAAAGAGAGR